MVRRKKKIAGKKVGKLPAILAHWGKGLGKGGLKRGGLMSEERRLVTTDVAAKGREEGGSAR